MDDATTRALLAAPVALLVVAAAWKSSALSTSGAVAAWAVGTATVAGGGWWTGALLAWFFVSSTLLGRLVRGSDDDQIAVRGSRRDAVQVVANGGLPALLALLAGLVPAAGPAALTAAAGALAAATADTWATEVGRTSPAPPRSVLSGRPVAPGTSGGITARGTLGALTGAASIAAVALIAAPLAPNDHVSAAFPIILAGIVGSTVDSLLGATLQAVYRCPRCRAETERRVHTCGATTALVRGHHWITNDVVNAAAGLAGALVAATVATV